MKNIMFILSLVVMVYSQYYITKGTLVIQNPNTPTKFSWERTGELGTDRPLISLGDTINGYGRVLFKTYDGEVYRGWVSIDRIFKSDSVYNLLLADSVVPVPVPVYGSFDVGYTGIFMDGGSYQGFCVGGVIGNEKILGGAEVGLSFDKDKVIDSITDNHGQTEYQTIECSSILINPNVILGSEIIKVSGGVVVMTAKLNGTKLDNEIGFSTGIRINIPAETLISPFIGANFVRVAETSMFGLKLGLSFGNFEKKQSKIGNE